MTIRPATGEDVGAVTALVASAYGGYVPRLGREPGPMLDDYGRRVDRGQTFVFEHDGAIVGVLVLERQPDALLLENVAVLPAAQGRGFGHALIAYAEQEARRLGYAVLRLYTHVLMTENIRLYRSLGFRETHRIAEKGFQRVYMARPVDRSSAPG